MRRGLGLKREEARLLCQANRELSRRVASFLDRVGSAREESVTEYLLWQWREIDDRFDYLIANQHSSAKEKTTGADFDLDLWLVGQASATAYLVQAKKFLELYDGYRARLNYPEGKPTGSQLTNLVAHARKTKRLPVYLIYADEGLTANALHVVAAKKIKSRANGKARVSVNEIVGDGLPFESLFCLPHEAAKQRLIPARVPVADLPATVLRMRLANQIRHMSQSQRAFYDSHGFVPTMKGAISRPVDASPVARAAEELENGEDDSQMRSIAVLDLTLPYRGKQFG